MVTTVTCHDDTVFQEVSFVLGLWSLVFGLWSGLRRRECHAESFRLQPVGVPGADGADQIVLAQRDPAGKCSRHRGLEVGYDVKKGQCYVRKEVVLPAKESVSYNVVIDDIWLVNEEDLERRRNYTYKLRDQLLRSDYAGTAKAVAGEIEAMIQSVRDKQEENLVEKVAPVEHIGAYELNQEDHRAD